MYIHVIFGDNSGTQSLIDLLVQRDDGIVTVIDSKHAAIHQKDKVTYANMRHIKHLIETPNNISFYMHLDPQLKDK